MSFPSRNRISLCRLIAGFCLLIGLAATPGTVSAGDDAKSSAPKTKWILPPHYDKLDLSDDQKARVTRILEVYNPKINNLINLINRGGIGTFSLSTTLQKLRNDRQRFLSEVLTNEQREKFRELSAK